MATASFRPEYITRPLGVALDADRKLVGVRGTTEEFELPQNESIGTTKFLGLTTVPGVPTNTSVPEGRVAYNSAVKEIFFFNGTSWVQLDSTAATNSWEQVLAAGNSTGANVPAFQAGFTMAALSGAADPALPRISTLAGPPGGVPPDGALMVDTASNELNFAAGGSWSALTPTSVGLSAPAEFAVSGSPVTGVGTLTVTSLPQNANFVWAGPSAGVPGAPTFRSLVSADLPAIPAETWAATLVAGNTTGNTTPTITNDQEILFNTGIRIGGGGGSSAAAAASAISIGPTLNAAGVTSIAVGNLAQTPNLNSIGFGNGARGLADNAIAVGTSARADGDNAVSLGRLTTSYAPGSVALGYNANVPVAHTNSVQVGAGVTTAANQVRLGGPSSTVSVPGALELEPMSLATDNGRHFTVPTFAGPPLTTPLDGTIMVDTANQLLNFRAGGAWITCPNAGTGPVEYAVAGIFSADAAQVQTGSGAFQLVQLKSTQNDTGGIVNLASDRLDFGTNETWHISVYWVGTEVGSHGGNAVLQGRIMQHNNGINSEVGLSIQEWETHANSFSVNISAVIRTGSTGAQYVYCEMKDSETDDVSIKPFRISASRDS